MRQNQIGQVNLDPKDRHFDLYSCCNSNRLLDENSIWGVAFMMDSNSKCYGRQAWTVTWGGMLNTYYYIDLKSGIAANINTQH